MKSFDLIIPLTKPEEDLTIIYKERQKSIQEIKTISNEFFDCLRYFQPRCNEIDQMKMICIQEDISSDIFINFISSIQTKKVKINEENYQQYYYLSSKYEYTEMKNQIEAFIEERPDIISVIQEISKNSSEYNSTKNKEEIVAKNLDVSIKSGFLSKVDIKIIIRIINSPKRVIKDHHLLFNFVVDLIRNFKKDETKKNLKDIYLILPSALDYSLMTEDEMIELFEVEGDEDFLSPSNGNEIMKNIISKSQKYVKIQEELESRLKSLESKFDEMEKKHKQDIQDLREEAEKKNKQFDDLLKKFESQKPLIDNLTETIETVKRECFEKNENERKKLQQQINDLNEKVAKIESDEKVMKSKIDEEEKKNQLQCEKIGVLERRMKQG